MSKFSEAYIQFVTNSKLIQALWRKRGVRVGDWMWHPGTEQFEPEAGLIAKLYTTGGELCAEVCSNNAIWGPTELVGDWAWLPTLDDLVEERERLIGVDPNYKIIRMEAARLLERVLEEEGDDRTD